MLRVVRGPFDVAYDAVLSVDHTTLVVLGAVSEADQPYYLRNYNRAFWCVFGDGEWSWSKSGPIDTHFHTFLRSCSVPSGVQRRLDDGLPVRVGFALPYTNSSHYYELQPHSFRCRQRHGHRRFSERGRHLYRLVACSLVFDDDGLVEWIEFHLLQGYEHFFLYYYYKDYSDELGRLLRGYVSAGTVTLIDWRMFSEQPAMANDWIMHQVQAFNHCINRYGMLTKWMSIHDRDEFMLSLRGSIPDLLDSIPLGHHSHFSVRNWFYTPLQDARA